MERRKFHCKLYSCLKISRHISQLSNRMRISLSGNFFIQATSYISSDFVISWQIYRLETAEINLSVIRVHEKNLAWTNRIKFCWVSNARFLQTASHDIQERKQLRYYFWFLDRYCFSNSITCSSKWPYNFQFVTDKEEVGNASRIEFWSLQNHGS